NEAAEFAEDIHRSQAHRQHTKCVKAAQLAGIAAAFHGAKINIAHFRSEQSELDAAEQFVAHVIIFDVDIAARIKANGRIAERATEINTALRITSSGIERQRQGDDFAEMFECIAHSYTPC